MNSLSITCDITFLSRWPSSPSEGQSTGFYLTDIHGGRLLHSMKLRLILLFVLSASLCAISSADEVTGIWILEGGKYDHRFEVEVLPATDPAEGYWLVHTEGNRLVYEGRYVLKNARLSRVEGGPKLYDGIAFRREGERWVWAGDRKNTNLAPYVGALLRRPKAMAADAPFNELGQSRLYVATLNNDSKEILRLLDTGTLIDGPNKNKRKRSALYAAVEMGYTDLATLLLEKGANVNQKDADGVTPLMAAGQNAGPYPKMVRLLLDKGADAAIKDKQGLTAVQRLEKAKAGPFRDILVKELESRK